MKRYDSFAKFERSTNGGEGLLARIMLEAYRELDVVPPVPEHADMLKRMKHAIGEILGWCDVCGKELRQFDVFGNEESPDCAKCEAAEEAAKRKSEAA